MLYAMLLGVAFHYLGKDAQSRPGIEFCSRSLLRLGIGLLGARITASQIAGLGWAYSNGGAKTISWYPA
jgi:uncharacterized membrane protein YadS